MIKINFSFNNDFLVRYKKNVITDRLIPAINVMISEAPVSDKARLLEVFTNEFIQDLVLCDAENLNEMISTIYDGFHELAERYCLEYYLKDIVLDSNIVSMPIMKKSDKSQFKVIHDGVVHQLKLLSDERKSIYLPIIIAKMEGTTVSSEMKKQLTLINSMKLGKHVLSEEITSLFPTWVTSFYKIFDYDAMSNAFGHEITNEMDLNVCLYCNNEDIETIKKKGAESRPDLDHFFPRSKFPFLAVTLSNLIPAGKRCNQTYKKAHSMLDYIHPFIDGINQVRLFNFNYIFDEGRSVEAINVTINSLNNNLDKNLALFNVEATHNKENVRNWFLNLEERYQLLVNSGLTIDEVLDNYDLVRIMLDVDVNRSPKKEQFQKLKLDALNLLSNRNYEMVE